MKKREKPADDMYLNLDFQVTAKPTIYHPSGRRQVPYVSDKIKW